MHATIRPRQYHIRLSDLLIRNESGNAMLFELNDRLVSLDLVGIARDSDEIHCFCYRSVLGWQCIDKGDIAILTFLDVRPVFVFAGWTERHGILRAHYTTLA